MKSKNVQFEGVKASMTLSVADKNRLDELTNFYRQLNGVVETIIDKFGTMERVTSKFMKANGPVSGTLSNSPYTPLSNPRSVQPDFLQHAINVNPLSTPNRIAPSQIVFEDSSRHQVVNQDTEPPHMRPISPNVIKKLVQTPEPSKEKLQTAGGRDGPPYETMLPSVHEELKSLEVQSLGGGAQARQRQTKKSNSRSRRSAQQASDAHQELKSKVSRMMSNHSLLVEDLKQKSSGNGRASNNKRRSIYSGVDNPGPAAGLAGSMDKQSVDTLAHEINAYGKTIEKNAAAQPNVGQARAGSRRLSSSRRETPLRNGANMQLSRE